MFVCVCVYIGLRPLHYATYQKYEKAVALLLVRGCDVNAMDDVGYTAIHLCAERGYVDLMAILIEHSARIKFTQLKPDDRVSCWTIQVELLIFKLLGSGIGQST